MVAGGAAASCAMACRVIIGERVVVASGAMQREVR